MSEIDTELSKSNSTIRKRVLKYALILFATFGLLVIVLGVVAYFNQTPEFSDDILTVQEVWGGTATRHGAIARIVTTVDNKAQAHHRLAELVARHEFPNLNGEFLLIEERTIKGEITLRAELEEISILEFAKGATRDMFIDATTELQPDASTVYWREKKNGEWKTKESYTIPYFPVNRMDKKIEFLELAKGVPTIVFKDTDTKWTSYYSRVGSELSNVFSNLGEEDNLGKCREAEENREIYFLALKQEAKAKPLAASASAASESTPTTQRKGSTDDEPDQTTAKSKSPGDYPLPLVTNDPEGDDQPPPDCDDFFDKFTSNYKFLKSSTQGFPDIEVSMVRTDKDGVEHRSTIRFKFDSKQKRYRSNKGDNNSYDDAMTQFRSGDDMTDLVK